MYSTAPSAVQAQQFQNHWAQCVWPLGCHAVSSLATDCADGDASTGDDGRLVVKPGDSLCIRFRTARQEENAFQLDVVAFTQVPCLACLTCLFGLPVLSAAPAHISQATCDEMN